jgi:hypothetical protein
MMKTYALTLPFQIGERLTVCTSWGTEIVELVAYTIAAHGVSFVCVTILRRVMTISVQADQIVSHRHVLDGFEFVGLAGAPTAI